MNINANEIKPATFANASFEACYMKHSTAVPKHSHLAYTATLMKNKLIGTNVLSYKSVYVFTE